MKNKPNPTRSPNRSRRAARGVRLSLAVAASAAAFPGLLPQLAHAQAVDCVQPLMFGSIVPCSAAAGTVTVNPDDTTSSSPGCINVTGPLLKGRCIVNGSFLGTRLISVSLANVTATLANGGDDMQVKNPHMQNEEGASGSPTITVTAFLTTVSIGATLHVDGGQAGGSYSGSYTVNVNYQ